MDTKLNGHKKGLKIPKGGNQKPYFKEGQTDNTITKRKGTKRTNNQQQNTIQKD